MLLPFLAASVFLGDLGHSELEKIPEFTVSSSHGKSFISDRNNISKSPQLIEETTKITPFFPFALLVSTQSYLEIAGTKNFRLRIGQSSVLEFLSSMDFNLLKGSFLICQNNTSNWTVSTSKTSIEISGQGTWMIEKTKYEELKFILLEGDGTLEMNGTSIQLQAGNMTLSQSSENGFSKLLDIELPLILSTSRLINKFESPLPSRAKLISAARVQSMRLKRRYQALVGGTNENNELRLWAIKQEAKKKSD